MQKNIIFVWTILISLCLLVIACGNQKNTVSFPETIYTSHGFAIQLPRGKTWLHKVGKNETLMSVKKLPKDGTHSFYTGAVEIVMASEFNSPQQFLEVIKQKKESTPHPKDYRLIEAEYKLQPNISPFCVYYHQKIEDHVAKNIGSNEFLILENFGYSVLHPEMPKHGIDIFYSERYANGESSQELRKEGIDYLKTLKIVSEKEMQELIQEQNQN